MTAQAGFAPHVMSLGHGPRRALALHCTMAFGGAWGGVARVLGGDLTLVAPDMPSHGQSADWDGVSDFGDTVYAACAAQLGDAPMDIIGHSFGAAIALRLAKDMPEKIRSMILFEPVFFAAALADGPGAMGDHDARAAPFIEAIKAGNMDDAARKFNRMWGEGPKWDSLPERTRAAMARAVHVVPDTTRFLYDDTSGLLAPGGLDVVTIPTLFMRGEHALPAIIATNDGLARRMGNATQSVIPGAGHMAPISHPSDVAKEIAKFLALH